MKRLLILVFLVSPLWATNKTVKSAGGGDFTTIQACATAMAAGDTCTVFAGTYPENVIVTAGAVGSYKTLQVNSGDTVYVLSFTVASHDKILGFHIQNPASPNTKRCVTIGDTATDVWIQNNSMTACLTVRSATSAGTPSYVYLQNNTLTYLCSSPTASPIDVCEGALATGDHWLIEGNEFSHLSDGVNVVSFTVVRGNYFHDFLENECVYSGNGSNCHFDFAQVEPFVATKYILIEGNRGGNNQGGYDSLGNSHGNGHGLLMQGNACPAPSGPDPYPCSEYIARFNRFVHVAGGSILDNLGANSMGFSHVKVYNNTWGDFNFFAPTGGVTGTFTQHSSFGSEVNELFYYPQSLTGLNPYICDDRVAGSSTCASFTAHHNLAWCSGTCNFYGEVYTTGTFLVDAGANNLTSDPKLVDLVSDLHLQASSPALHTGGALTTVTSATGSGASMVVDDCHYFQWGYGLIGVQGDTIGVGATSAAAKANSVQITAVDYSTCTLSLASSISWTNGNSVYAIKDSSGNFTPGFGGAGTAPNIGALGAVPVAPYTTTATCLGSANGTIACTNNPGAGYTCPTPAISATCTAGVASGQTTQLAADGDIPEFTATGSFVAWAGACTGVANPCTASAIHDNGNITAQFSTLPTITVTSNTNYCNPVNGCSPTYTATIANCNVAGCVWSVLDYPSGAILTDATTGQLAYCAYGITVNALCGDGTHPSGTFSIRRTITDFSQGSGAQAIGNVFIPPNVLVQASPVLVGFGSFVAPGGSWLTF